MLIIDTMHSPIYQSNINLDLFEVNSLHSHGDDLIKLVSINMKQWHNII